jgi:hypothetical protein
VNNGSFNLAEKLPYVSLNDLRADDGIWKNISTFD